MGYCLVYLLIMDSGITLVISVMFGLWEKSPIELNWISFGLMDSWH